MTADELFQLLGRLAGDECGPERRKRLEAELAGGAEHELRESSETASTIASLYGVWDPVALQDLTPPGGNASLRLRSLDELLDRDRRREKDGFPRKIRVGKLIKPGRGDRDKVVVVPTTVEEKLVHDKLEQPDDEQTSGGVGEGEEGEVIGEQPVRPDGAGQGGAGQGAGGQHEIESSAYDLGRILTEQFELPNLKDKGKKRFLTRYTYDLTDRHRGFGQVLDKKQTLRRILETNVQLGNVPDVTSIDPSRFLIAPDDRVFRILSKEKDYESQAVVFFVRDYSGSMIGKPTELVVSQHVLIYSWLLYQYAQQVTSRFILHDTEAREVDDFFTYYSSTVAGGTQVASAYRLVNEIVEKESLARDYNIYVFHGTDGDDWDTDGVEALPELEKMMTWANRIGVSITQRSGMSGPTEVQRYLEASQLLTLRPDLLRMDVLSEDASESRIIEGIKVLIG